MTLLWVLVVGLGLAAIWWALGQLGLRSKIVEGT